MLFSLKADNQLYKNIIEDVRSNRIHSNEVINALKISKKLIEGGLNVCLVAPMQSGKTGSIKYLCNKILTALGYLKKNQTACFTTSMRDSSLFRQNTMSLEHYGSNILVNKVDRLKLLGLKDASFYNYGLIIRDEDQYGSGKESTFDHSFFTNTRKAFKEMPLVSVSATPYDVMDAKNSGYDVSIVSGERPSSYFGITEMLNQNMVEDLPRNYQHFISDKTGKKIISKQIIEGCFKLKTSNKGLGIIRCNNTKEAIYLKDQLKSLIQNNIQTLVIGCRTECDMTIEEGLNRLPFLVERANKKVILLVINALSAGKDLKELKKHVRFVIETKKSQLANIAQGLPGRICGYHSNRDLKIYASKKVLEHFSEFENNPIVIEDKDWTNKLFYDENIKALSTQTKLESQVKKGVYRPIIERKKYSIKDLFEPNIEDELSFISTKTINKLIGCFHKDYYNKKTRSYYIIDEKTNIYVSAYSSYSTENFEKNWKAKLKDNMNKMFPKIKDDCFYGILVSNYPKNHVSNKTGFCGIQVFKCGKKEIKNQLSSPVNYSMYERL